MVEDVAGAVRFAVNAGITVQVIQRDLQRRGWPTPLRQALLLQTLGRSVYCQPSCSRCEGTHAEKQCASMIRVPIGSVVSYALKSPAMGTLCRLILLDQEALLDWGFGLAAPVLQHHRLGCDSMVQRPPLMIFL